MEADFASVWSRVTGERPTEDAQAKLRRWIQDESEAVWAYRCMLRAKVPSQARETIAVLLKEENRELRRLQTLYYLRTGDILDPAPPQERKKQPLLSALRERYAAVLMQAESYRQASALPNDLQALCGELASEKDGQALLLRQLTACLL